MPPCSVRVIIQEDRSAVAQRQSPDRIGINRRVVGLSLVKGRQVYRMPYFVYILRNRDGRFYVGQTSDLKLRLQGHNKGRGFWTKGRGPWELVYSAEFETRSQAISEERRLKRLKSKKALEKLVSLSVES